MSNLYAVLRNQIEGLILGTVGNGGRVISSGRFKSCPQDKTVENIPVNDCERSFRLFFQGMEEFEDGWNSLNVDAREKIQFCIKIAYQYTRGGMYPEEYEGLSKLQGNGDIDSVNDRAFSDAVELIKTISYYENYGILQASPKIDVFSFHPLNKNSLDLFNDRAILTINMEAWVQIDTTSDYGGM